MAPTELYALTCSLRDEPAVVGHAAFEELIIPDKIHDLLRWRDWIRAYRATAEFFDRKLAASSERQ